MKKYRLNYSPDALCDLNDIWDYIDMELCNQNAAITTVNSIMDKIDLLLDFPDLGTTLSSVTGVISDYRFLISGNYLAFYRIVNSNIYVDRVLYRKRDYLRVLFDEQDDFPVKNK